MKYYSDLIKLKKKIPFEIANDELVCLSLDISRSADSKITKAINDFKIKNNIKITSRQKNLVRDFIIGKTQWQMKGISPIDKDNILTDGDIQKSLIILLAGIERNPEKVFGTLKSRLEKKRNKFNQNIKKYKKIFSNLEKDQNQLLILKVGPEENLLNKLKSVILTEYDNLSNYHTLAVVFEDSEKEKISWNLISQLAIFSEYIKTEENFSVFNRQKRKKQDELINFLKNNRNISFDEELKEQVLHFYDALSYGFQFNDLFISKDGDVKVLILQKIKLDEKPYPCPDCMKTDVRGNSYPKVLQKSFECQNAHCPSRSKIGRGKRFDLLGVKRNLMIELNNKNDIVPQDFAKKFRRDIFDSEDYLDMIIRFYSWNKNNVLIVHNFQDNDVTTKGNSRRKITYKKLQEYKQKKVVSCAYEKLFSTIIKKIKIKHGKPENKKNGAGYSVYNGNSSEIIPNLPEKITGAITSPPYFNAREYSQWPTLICYLIDMAINAKAVLDKLEDGSYYFYNIGDIVGQDNIYVASHMSKRRLMLGFYSANIFEILGFNFIDNIIWDKGQVQSKRNSTENLFPGYIKPINCYEHILIFGKNQKKIKLDSKVLVLDSVKKINSKGENTLGHTAPYPEELVRTIFPFLDKSGYLLDPFLGSGTTIISSLKNKVKAVGVELNRNYYSLGLDRIENSIDENNRDPQGNLYFQKLL